MWLIFVATSLFFDFFHVVQNVLKNNLDSNPTFFFFGFVVGLFEIQWLSAPWAFHTTKSAVIPAIYYIIIC